MVPHKYILFAYYGHTAGTLLWPSEISYTYRVTQSGVNTEHYASTRVAASHPSSFISFIHVPPPPPQWPQEMVRYLGV